MYRISKLTKCVLLVRPIKWKLGEPLDRHARHKVPLYAATIDWQTWTDHLHRHGGRCYQIAAEVCKVSYQSPYFNPICTYNTIDGWTPIHLIVSGPEVREALLVFESSWRFILQRAITAFQVCLNLQWMKNSVNTVDGNCSRLPARNVKGTPNGEIRRCRKALESDLLDVSAVGTANGWGLIR